MVSQPTCRFLLIAGGFYWQPLLLAAFLLAAFCCMLWPLFCWRLLLAAFLLATFCWWLFCWQLFAGASFGTLHHAPSSTHDKAGLDKSRQVSTPSTGLDTSLDTRHLRIIESPLTSLDKNLDTASTQPSTQPRQPRQLDSQGSGILAVGSYPRHP